MKKLLTIASSLLIVLQGNLANACSCLRTTPQQSLSNSQAVFAGRVIDVIQPNPVETQNSRRRPTSNPEEIKVVFEVSQVWKGGRKARLMVMTSNSSAGCGYSFQKGEEYLVYASRQASRLTTGLCSGTKPLSTASEDLAVLGQGNVIR